MMCMVMNNIVYGKTMENSRNRVDAGLVNNEKDYLKRTSKPSYVTQKIFDHNFLTFHKIKATCYLTIQHISKCVY